MRLIVSFLALILWQATWATGAARAEKTSGDAPRITLVTFGPGTDVHQYFGHNALVVAGGDYSEPAVYNYGMFGFGPGMIPKFLRGRLEFWTAALALGPTFANYRAANRDIRVIPLEFSDAQREQVVAELERDASPAYRDYLYNHYDNNCSTRVRDVIDHALHGELKRALSGPARFTLRGHTRRYTQQDPLIEWLMMFGLSDSVDQPITQWDETFLPDELERALLRLPEPTRAIVGTHTLAHDAHQPPPPEAPATRWPWILLLGLLNAALVVWTGLRAQRVNTGSARWAFAIVHGQLALLLGFLGSLLLSLRFTDHIVAHGNENLFMCNPLPLIASLLTFGLLTQSARVEAVIRALWLTLAASTLIWLALKPLIPALDQDVSMTATLIAPINLAFAFVFWKRARLRA